MVPFITGEIAFRQHVCELVFGVIILDLDSGVQIDSVNQPIQRNSVGLGHVSHRRTSSFHDHLFHSFIVLENVYAGLRSEKSFALVTSWSTLDSSSTSRLLWVFVLVLGVGVFALNLVARSVSRRPNVGLIARSVSRRRNVFRKMQYFYYQVPKINRVYSVHAKPASREATSDSVELCDTEVCSKHTQLRNERSTSEVTCTFLPRSMLGLRGPTQSLSLGTIPSTMLRRITHMAMLSVITRVMNVGYQTSQAFVAGSSPFCDCSCKFVHGPKNVRSTNLGQIQAFQHNLRAHLDNSPTVSNPSLLKLWSSKHVVETLHDCFSLFVGQFAISFHALFRMTFHIVRPRDCFCVKFLPPR